MTTSPRDRISVDLRGLGPRLLEQARSLDMSPSALVRRAVVDELEKLDRSHHLGSDSDVAAERAKRARLCLRMSAADATLVLAAANKAGVNPGTYVGSLAAGVPAIAEGGYRDHIIALRASNAELATLGRNIHRLLEMLRQGDLRQARRHREMLDRVARDIRAHLQVAATVLAGLTPTHHQVRSASQESFE